MKNPRRTSFCTAVLIAAHIVMSNSLPAQDAAAQLEKLFDDSWQFAMREDPLFATHTGDARYNDLLPSESVADELRRAEKAREFLKRLKAIDRAVLPPADQVNYDVFAWLTESNIAESEFQTYLMPITNRSGFHVQFAELYRDVPLRTVKDYENYIARLRAFKKYAEQHVELLREAIKQKMTLPAVALVGIEESVEAHIVDDPEKSVLYKAFADFPDTFSKDDCQRLRDEGKKAIAESIVPGYAEFLEFLKKEYLPAARDDISASTLPRGRELYRHRVRRFTTLAISPEEVHEIGLREVKRIRAEMDEVRKKAKFEGDLDAFVEHLRQDEQFYAKTPEQLMERTALVLKKMDGQLPGLFKTLPRTPYGIRPVPDYIARKTTTAYYSPAPADGTRAGFYYVNTYDLKSRPLYEVEALSLHEAVPGHHLQIAIQQELTGMPNFRRFAPITAYVEGWGLYAERLGLECSFYQDPYSDFGRLSYEMWRACRLVVDTGMHYLGWSRERAIEFMAENTALARHNIVTEVDRYISWPGQALAYKMGELKIRQLRTKAEEALGERFDVREFHDVVLSSGAVPLSVLEANVEAHIRQKS
jgi:uncharacterized protein (DUF885 family)